MALPQKAAHIIIQGFNDFLHAAFYLKYFVHVSLPKSQRRVYNEFRFWNWFVKDQFELAFSFSKGFFFSIPESDCAWIGKQILKKGFVEYLVNLYEKIKILDSFPHEESYGPNGKEREQLIEEVNLSIKSRQFKKTIQTPIHF